MDSPSLPALFVKPGSSRLAVKPQEQFIGFVADQESADVLRLALSSALPAGINLSVTNFSASLNILNKLESAKIVLVDISEEDQPFNAIMALAEVVAPGTTVLVVGEANSVNIYRTITKSFGVKEYLVKPLTVEAVRKYFLNFIAEDTNSAALAITPRTGRMIAVTGMTGGIGCSTIATNLAWVIGGEMYRHTLLLDADLYFGTSSLYLNVPQSAGFYLALESPERIDSLLVERSVQKVASRLDVLSTNTALETDVVYSQKSATSLVQVVRARYTFVIADVGHQLLPFTRDLLDLAEQKVVVMNPSVVSIRNLERFDAMPNSPRQLYRQILVLNQAGCSGGLDQSAMERAIGRQFDVVIPYMPRIVPEATKLGFPAVEIRGRFHRTISQLADVVGATKRSPDSNVI